MIRPCSDITGCQNHQKTTNSVWITKNGSEASYRGSCVPEQEASRPVRVFGLAFLKAHLTDQSCRLVPETLTEITTPSGSGGTGPRWRTGRTLTGLLTVQQKALTPEMGTPASEPDLWRNRKKVHLDAIVDIDCLKCITVQKS